MLHADFIPVLDAKPTIQVPRSGPRERIGRTGDANSPTGAKLTVARINWEYRTRRDPQPKKRQGKLKGRPLWALQVSIDLKRLLDARAAKGPDPIIQQYLDNPDLIWRGTSTTIGAEVELALAERIRLGITSLRPYDVPWRVCRRLTKLARNSRKKLKAREERRAAGMKPWSESLAQTKPWLAEGISRSTWYSQRRKMKLSDNGKIGGNLSDNQTYCDAQNQPSDESVPPPNEELEQAAHSSPSKIEEEENREDHAGNGRGRSNSSARIDLSRWRCRRVGLSLGEIEGRISRGGPRHVESGLNRSHSRSELIEEGQPMAPELPETEPKPNHFRGETMEQLRPDDLKDANPVAKKFNSDRRIPLRDRACGHWLAILPALGIHPSFLKIKNGPCPMCGGKDRWRFYDPAGVGSWFCNNCGGGDGIALAMKFLSLPFTDVAKRIDSILGDAPLIAVPPRRTEPNRDALLALWRRGRPIEPDDPVDRYLTGRGITIRDYPKCLRFVRQAKHADGSIHPAMLAAVSDTDGKSATIHKTYLTVDGQKADVDRVRLFYPGLRPEGGAVRLAAHGVDLGIAEGIETALSASQLHGVPVWAALDTGGVERFIPPPDVTRLIIFGDNDSNFSGHKAAYCLAMRAILVLKIKVEVKIPDRAGTDWNDVLRGVQP
jgi:putative DNA primase/helicase